MMKEDGDSKVGVGATDDGVTRTWSFSKGDGGPSAFGFGGEPLDEILQSFMGRRGQRTRRRGFLFTQV